MSETTVSPLFPAPDSGKILLGRGVDVLEAVKDVAVVIQGCPYGQVMFVQACQKLR
jgi:hypothetical protein